MLKTLKSKWIIFCRNPDVRLREPNSLAGSGRHPGRRRQFLISESGGATVDWIVLTAALVTLAIAALTTVSAGTQELSNDMKKCLEIQARLLSKDIPNDTRMKRAARRCGRL